MEKYNSEFTFTVGDSSLVIACKNDFHRAFCYSVQNSDMLEILINSKFYKNFNWQYIKA